MGTLCGTPGERGFEGIISVRKTQVQDGADGKEDNAETEDGGPRKLNKLSFEDDDRDGDEDHQSHADEAAHANGEQHALSRPVGKRGFREYTTHQGKKQRDDDGQCPEERITDSGGDKCT